MDDNSFLKKYIEEEFNLFSKIFSYEIFNEDFLDYLKKIEKPSNNVCAKMFGPNDKAVRCKNCLKDEDAIMCLDCFEKSKEFHKNHTILYETDIEGGCCDCGNSEAWDKNTFCPLHKGNFVNEEEINNFIKDNFDEDIIIKIKNWFNNFTNILIPYFLENEKNNSIKDNDELDYIIDNFFEFLSNIFSSNSALLQLFSQLIIKNYPFETNHNCVEINDKNEVNIINFNGQIHLCKCSFLKIIFSAWTNKIEDNELFFFFLQNNKLKINVGLIYLSIYDKILYNNLENLQNFICQVFHSEVF